MDLHEMNNVIRTNPEKLNKDEMATLISVTTEALAAVLGNASTNLDMTEEDRKIFAEAAQAALAVYNKVGSTQFFS